MSFTTDRSATGSFLFAYGTLRSGLSDTVIGSELRQLLEHLAESRGKAKLRGLMYDLGSYPGVVLSSDPHHVVHGEVFWLGAEVEEQILILLDAYEGTAPEAGSEFIRMRCSVETPMGDVKAWVYVYSGPQERALLITGGDYQLYCPGK